jgi:hypothetical protein
MRDCSHHRPLYRHLSVTESVALPPDPMLPHREPFSVIQIRLEKAREARALPPGTERNQKRQVAQSLKRLIESQIQMRDNPPRRASRH